MPDQDTTPTARPVVFEPSPDLREAIGVALRDWRTADRGGTTPEVTIKEILLLGTDWCNSPRAEEEIDRLTDCVAAAVEPLVQQPALEPEEDAGLRLLSVSGPDATRRRYVLGAKPEPRAPVSLSPEEIDAAAEALIWNRLEDAAIHLLDEASLPVRVILAGDGRLFDLAHEIARSLEDLTAQGENGEEGAEKKAEASGIKLSEDQADEVYQRIAYVSYPRPAAVMAIQDCAVREDEDLAVEALDEAGWCEGHPQQSAALRALAKKIRQLAAEITTRGEEDRSTGVPAWDVTDPEETADRILELGYRLRRLGLRLRRLENQKTTRADQLNQKLTAGLVDRVAQLANQVADGKARVAKLEDKVGKLRAQVKRIPGQARLVEEEP